MIKGSEIKKNIKAYKKPIIYHWPATLRQQVTPYSWLFCMLYLLGAVIYY